MTAILFDIPDFVAYVLNALEAGGYEAYLVGGCVRDYMMGLDPHDYDVATQAAPQEVARLFTDCRVVETGVKHGTVTVVVRGMPVEVTTYRVDGAYEDFRRPARVAFTRALEEDLARRDFTVNAMAYSPARGLRDPFGGVRDLEKKVIACVGDPAARFSEDALRVLRALRFSSRLGFSIEPETAKALRACAPNLAHISHERILAEFEKLLVGQNVLSVLTGYPDVIGVFIPEILESVGFDQKNPHHIYDVYTHTCVAVAACPRDRLLRLSAFFHDIAKPRCFTQSADGTGHFYGHAAQSAKMAADILRRLKADNETIRIVSRLVEYHMDRRPLTKKSVRRLLHKMTPGEARMLIALRRADVVALNPACAADTSHLDRLSDLIDEVERGGDCVSMQTLAVNGRDLIALGMAPGPEMGRVLARLLDAVIDGALENDRDVLLNKARVWMARSRDRDR